MSVRLARLARRAARVLVGLPLLALSACASGGGPAPLEPSARLWEAGQRSSAARRDLERLLAGPGPGFAAAAARVAAALDLPVESEGLVRVPALDLSTLEEGLRERLLQRAALERLRRGDLGGAAQVLARRRSGTARYLLALLELARGDRAAARRALLAAVTAGGRATGEEPGGGGELRDLGELALARLAGAEGRLEEAATRYAAVGPASPHFFRARQELAWVLLERGDAAGALAQSVALQHPAHRHRLRADRELVEAAALLELCRPAQARVRAELGRTRLAGHVARLTVFLRERPDLRLYYLEAMSSAAGRGPLPQELAVALLADASFYRAYRVVRQVQRERALLAGSRLGPELGAELDGRLLLAQRRAGEAAQRLLAALRSELSELRLRTEELLFEVERRGAEELVGRRSASRPAREEIARGRAQRWPFSGEHWSDEVRHLRARSRSSCR